MTWQSWAFLVGFVALGGVELAALVQKDRPGAPRTLTANIRWLIQGAGVWHVAARAGLVLALAWLGPHLLGGGS